MLAGRSSPGKHLKLGKRIYRVAMYGLETTIRAAIARISDRYQSSARNLAAQLAGAQLGSIEVRALARLASTTDKISDITDYLKFRVGQDFERKSWGRNGIGRDLVTTLESLRADAERIVAKLPRSYPIDPDLVRQVHLRLCREFINHLVAHFEYLQ